MKFLIGFRKFTLATTCIILITIFLLTGHIVGTDYAKCIGIIVSSFMGSNIGEHLIKLGKEYITNKEK